MQFVLFQMLKADSGYRCIIAFEPAGTFF